MDPQGGPDADDGLTEEERATLAAGGRLVDDPAGEPAGDDDEGDPQIEGPNPA